MCGRVDLPAPRFQRCEFVVGEFFQAYAGDLDHIEEVSVRANPTYNEHERPANLRPNK